MCSYFQKANRYEIVETRICLSKNFTLMDCMKSTSLEGKIDDTRKGTANCPDTGIYYPLLKN